MNVNRCGVFMARVISEEKVQEKRELILKAALKVFSEKGYHGANIADIAAVLGMGHGTFYRYFRNKLDIFEAVLTEITDQIREVVSSSPAVAEDLDSYRRQLEQIMAGLFAIFIHKEDRLRVLIFEAWGAEPAMRAKLMTMVDECSRMTQAYLDNGMEKGFLRDDLDAPVVARMLNALIFQGLLEVMQSGNAMAAGLRSAQAGLSLMLFGIVKRG